MNPQQLQRTLQTALEHHQAGHWAEAERLYRQVNTAAPRLFDPLHLAGVLAYQRGRYAEALDLLNRALRIDPKSALCEMRVGLTLAALGRLPEAEARYRSALRRDPAMPEAWNNLAMVLKARGQPTEAAQSYQKAISLKPDYFDAIDRLGALLSDMQGLPAGIPYFRRAVEIQPDYAPAWCNLGLALNADGKFAEALQSFDRAIAADPKLVKAHVGRGIACQQNYQLDDALRSFDAALAIDPQCHEAWSSKLLTLNYVPHLSRETVFAQHQAFGAAVNPESQRGPLIRPNSTHQTPNTKLRVGFLSPDLRSHSVAYFLEPLLQHLDRQRFEVVLYHDHFQVDAVSERLRKVAALWRNFVGQADDTVAQQIRGDGIDILVDLAGHTGFNRLPLFARRLAPVQVAYLGYPNTTGLAQMDFRFVDPTTDPDGGDRFHTESLVRFAPTAWSYQPPAAAPEPAARPRGHPLTFGSFNNFAKVSDDTLKLWSRVLAAVPGSRLLLKAHRLDDLGLAATLHQRLASAGIAADRVDLLGRLPDLATHLATYHRIDIALDPYPYHGTTTTCEALWMGVPVITLLGDRHAARVGGSLLRAIGHPEWIAATPEDYVRIAIDLAGDHSLRQATRTELRDAMRRSDLLDHAGQARRFGDALVECWTRRGEASFAV